MISIKQVNLGFFEWNPDDSGRVVRALSGRWERLMLTPYVVTDLWVKPMYILYKTKTKND